jgi:WD40 repeat protein
MSSHVMKRIGVYLSELVLQKTLVGHGSRIWSCCFSPCGRLILSASADKTLKLWNAATGELHKTLLGHTDVVTTCCFSPNGQIILSGGRDRTLKTWDAATGQILSILEGHEGSVLGCCFSRDGRYFASGKYPMCVGGWVWVGGSHGLPHLLLALSFCPPLPPQEARTERPKFGRQEFEAAGAPWSPARSTRICMLEA